MNIVAISVGLAFGLVLIGVLLMAFSAVKSLMNGKQDGRKMIVTAFPFVIFAISYPILDSFAKAGIMTAAILLGVMLLAIVFTGLRGTFNV